MNKKIVLLFAAIWGLGFTGLSWASGTGAPQMESDSGNSGASNQAELSLYQQGLQATKAGDFEKARDLFQQALDQDPNNPDILNMLAHSQRKLGKIDDAIDNYKKALAIKPNFPEAREYLGETYVQAALQQLDILKSYGDSAKEEIEDLGEALVDAAKKI
jgi:tetratricopeptide (TPR) repeat protein